MSVPYGVFSISSPGKNPTQNALANANVDGITIAQTWNDLEPNEGEYHFEFLDGAIAMCAAHNKKVLLCIGMQNGKPAWVNTSVTLAGGSFFTFLNDGVPTTIPVFWDPTFLNKKTAMIAALGAHLTNNSNIVVVVASFANATSEDWNVPHAQTDIAQWLTLGYTSDKLVAAGQRIIDATMAAFPNQIVTLAVSGNGHLGGGLNLDPTSDYVPRTVVGLERALWPGRLNIQKNDLSTFIPPAPGTDSLYQMI
ncbi:MAG: beta-galactosidase [Chthoniobacterales bacterium]|nr:beta-galactosidase [Chthoniobacterales bacterium]